MAIEPKEIIMNVTKGVMFSIRISYRSVCAHPYISGILVFLLLLYRAFPLMFSFVISYFPVIVCTAILLGTLLSYGTPYIPGIEEEDKKTQEISSLQTGSIVDDVVVKKDESYSVESHLETDMEVNERAVEDAVGEASNRANDEIERVVLSGKMHDEGNRKDNTVLTANLLLQEDKRKMYSEMKAMEETKAVDFGFVEKGEFSRENKTELALELAADVGSTAVNDQSELGGLTTQIAKTSTEIPFYSSLGVPREPVDTCDASLGSDSDSDGAESSSPDASMTDIIPMLDELHPLLDSEHQPTLRAADSSDATSSESSEDHESDDGITEEEVENKEDTQIESQEKGGTDEAAVPWTEDDQKNVMDLGYSEEERNRRLENLIVRRRLRKLQRYETEKNLIDLDSYYPSPIASISAPRRNPFDLPCESDGNLNLPPIPGSAPPVLQPRKNPFDLPYEQVQQLTTLSNEYLSHHDFVASAQREKLARRNESSTVGPSFSGDYDQERKDLKLNPYFLAERMDSEDAGFTAIERQLFPKTDPIRLVSGPEISTVTCPEDHKEPTETGMYEERIVFSPISDDVEHVEQDRQSFEADNSLDNKHEQISMDVETDRAIEFNTTTNNEETNHSANDFGVMEEEIGQMEDNLLVSDTDTGKPEVVEERYEDSNSSSEEENEQISGVNIHEESANLKQSVDEPMQSDWVGGAQYDSSPTATRKTLSTISTPDEAFPYEDFSQVASPPRPFEANLSLEDQDHAVLRSEGEDLVSGIGKTSVESYVADENESRLREITEIKEHDAVKVGMSKTNVDVHPLVPVMPESATEKIMNSSSLSSGDSESSEDDLVGVDKSIQSGGTDMINYLTSVGESATHLPPEAGVQNSQVSILDLPSIDEENLEDANLQNHKIVISSPVSSGLTASQVEESNVHMFDAEQEQSTHQKVAEEIGNNDLAMGVVSEGNNGDVSVGLPVIPTDGGFRGSHVLELRETTEFSTLSEMKSEHEMGFNNDSSDSQSNITDEILSKREVGFLKSLNNSDKEWDDEVHAEVSGIKDIDDEGLLSELDVVGDFRAESELKLDQGGSYLELGKFVSVLEGSTEMQDSRDVKDADTLLGESSDSDKVNPVVDQTKSVKTEVGSSLLPSGEDPEMTVYNSKLRVLEACSIEELDSVFMKQHEEAVVPPPVSDLTVENTVSSESKKVTRESGVSNRNQELTGIDSELPVLEAKSVEDISSPLKQISEGLNEPSITEVETSEVLPERTHLEPDEINSDLHDIEARSLEDINLALKQFSEVNVESPPEEMKHEVRHAEAGAGERHLEPGVVSVQSSEVSETNLEPEHMNIQSTEEIKLDPVKATAIQTNMVVEQGSERSDGIAVAADVSTPIS